MSRSMMQPRYEKLFWAKVEIGKPFACWNWKGHKQHWGHGTFSTKKAHRVAYELKVGPIPPGLFLDHKCENPSCVNPRHLEPVTPRTNSLRSIRTIAHINMAKTHCPKGHPFARENLLYSKNGHNGARRCRICKNQQERLRDRAKRPQTRAYRQP